MTQNIQDILTQLDRVNSSYSYDVWIPSLGKDVSFKEMTTAQQKRIIKSIIDSPVYNSEFIKACYTIIKENCDDKTIEVDKFTIIDKLLILLKMRSVSIGNEIEVQLKSELLDKEIKSTINIDTVYDKCLETISHIKDTQIIESGITVDCCLPNILTEYKLEKQLHSLWDKEKYETREQIQNSVGEKFVSEIAKFIRQITIADNVYNLEEMDFKDRLQIIEKLPSKLLKEIFKYIQQCSDAINSILIISNKIEVEGETEDIEKRLEITPGFFINS